MNLLISPGFFQLEGIPSPKDPTPEVSTEEIELEEEAEETVAMEAVVEDEKETDLLP